MASWTECQLCPKYCHIAPGRTGDCRIRVNIDGHLVATTHGFPCSIHVDPIEKKPLFHFLPGSSIFSVATVGCNLHCKHCQNYEISQTNPEDMEAMALPPRELVDTAIKQGAISIAYTYTEPLAYYEYTLDCSRLAHEAGISNVLVTAGYINEPPIRALLPYVHAANIDIKAFSDKFYREICGGTLAPVLRTVEVAKEMGVWLEITYLVIPTLNDDPDEVASMCRWLVSTVGPDVPLHFSRFFPQYRLAHLPPTPSSTLERCRTIARQEGVRYVYVGNLRTQTGENTMCPNPDCPGAATPLIERAGFVVRSNRLVNGACPECGRAIPGVWQ